MTAAAHGHVQASYLLLIITSLSHSSWRTELNHCNLETNKKMFVDFDLRDTLANTLVCPNMLNYSFKVTMCIMLP